MENSVPNKIVSSDDINSFSQLFASNFKSSSTYGKTLTKLVKYQDEEAADASEVTFLNVKYKTKKEFHAELNGTIEGMSLEEISRSEIPPHILKDLLTYTFVMLYKTGVDLKSLNRQLLSKISLLDRMIGRYARHSNAEKNNVKRTGNVHTQFYQSTVKEELSLFDVIIDSDHDKMLLGLKLMEKGNEWRKTMRGQCQVILVGQDKNPAMVYFPRDNENVDVDEYTYARCVVHTARALSREMALRKDCSALGLKVGWGGLMQSENQSHLLSLFPKTEDLLPGIRALKQDRSVFSMVTIPKLRPHVHLRLSMAEACIFILFHMMNDISILPESSEKDRLKGKFASDCVRKLKNLNLLPKIEVLKKPMAYTVSVCSKNVKRKGELPMPFQRLFKQAVGIYKQLIETNADYSVDDLKEKKPQN